MVKYDQNVDSETLADGREIQLIYGDGTFNDAGVERFIKEVKLAECGSSYAVVSIIGPLCSGKSTLLNNLFHTEFTTMDALLGRKRTTEGIWMSRGVGIEPCTLVMDLEGTDGLERHLMGDTTFEKHSALFALAVSDIVLINMWYHDIGRERVDYRPLLITVFQAMMKLFGSHKITLMFVIRDAMKASLKKLKSQLLEGVEKIWDSVQKPPGFEKAALRDFFNVDVTGLPDYEIREEEFKKEVDDLRKWLIHSIAPGGLAGDRRGVVPASEFSFSAQQIWKVIKENRHLDLPAHKVLVATIRCEEIASEKVGNFLENEEWREIEMAMQSHPVPRFGERINSILDSYLSEYDAKVTYFDEVVRTDKRRQLEVKLVQHVQPCYELLVSHLTVKTLDGFRKAFDEALNGGEGFAAAYRRCSETFMAQFIQGCADATIDLANWDYSSEATEELQRDIDAPVETVRSAKLSERKYNRLSPSVVVIAAMAFLTVTIFRRLK